VIYGRGAYTATVQNPITNKLQSIVIFGLQLTL